MSNSDAFAPLADMAGPGNALLPPVRELQDLPPAPAQLVIDSYNAERKREHSYAVLGMVCGTFSLLGCIGSFTFLVAAGHPNAAGVILGTGVLAIIGRMIAVRL